VAPAITDALRKHGSNAKNNVSAALNRYPVPLVSAGNCTQYRYLFPGIKLVSLLARIVASYRYLPVAMLR
jgi:hypothetical protein